MERVEVATFAEIEAEFLARVHSAVWCSVASIDRQGRPRSRVWHSIWEGSTGWIATLNNTLKVRHLERSPYVSLAYIADVSKPTYADCTAEWAPDLADKQRIWDAFKDAPPPLGYDPAPIFGSPDRADFGLLKLTPWRIEIADVRTRSYIWHA